MQIGSLSRAEISSRLAQGQNRARSQPYAEFPHLHEIVPDPPRPAAVLIPLLDINNTWHILYTRRNANLPEHSGQVAFPGGRSDPEDTSLEMTALREAHEEIGLTPDDVQILGRIHDFLTITNYRVTPIVGIIPWPYDFHLAVQEVSRVFTIPLDWLAEPNNYKEQWRTLPAPYDPVSVIYYKEYDGEILWGASARFTLEFIKLLT